MQKELEANINSLKLKVSIASKTVSKDADDIFLIAVSKKKSLDYIKMAKDIGIKHFGENYAQELEDKAKTINGKITWHFIGPLQSNKSKIIAKYADWIHTIDRKKIADKINDECKKINKVINACIQVNISDESTKSGINPDDLLLFAKYVDSMENINLKGIMVLPSLGEKNRKQMQASKLLHEKLISAFPDAKYLSMGTTNDFETAIASGSNMVRVGELIFGKR
jgi:pyridoxal phosphate enzyme (YggS family)